LGGQGFGRIAEGVVLEELGRVLYPGPFLASAVVAAGVLVICGDPVASERYLPGIASGTLIATLARTEADPSSIADGFGTTACSAGAGSEVTVTGRKVAVIAGADADLFLVTATGPHGPAIVAIAADSPGVRVESEPVLDLTRRLATVNLEAAHGTPLDMVIPPREAFHRIENLVGAALVSEQVGAAAAVLDIAVGYASTRVQFGREIGSFQAVRHRLADLAATLEAATASARAAAACGDLGGADATMTIATAQSYCSEAFVEIAEGAIQILGGIGYTWEHPAHLYLKRAKSSELIFGDPGFHRRRLYEILSAAWD
jgi:alkylation response protein AidB-like acyl-CoA dehydrogenase